MTLDERKTAFVELGKFLSQFSENNTSQKEGVLCNDLFFDDFINLIKLSQSHNGWFTEEQVYFAAQSWADALTSENLDKWLNEYDFENVQPKTVGLILAGNIPLVGFHDFLSVLISGHRALVKTSSNDQLLLPFLAKYIVAVEPRFKDYISFTEGKLEGFDAVIATGSNNTARYFEYYFKNKPSIIRKNRNSAAVLTGNESKEELVQLGEDIFRYFGLGCRNVSKLFVPEGYNFTPFWEAVYEYRDIIQYEKYANNYDYNKAVFLMSNFKLLDNGFLTIKEDNSYSSPISSLFYEYYTNTDNLKAKLEDEKDHIQCIVGNISGENTVAFGQTQKPQLWDYADNVDTIAFLSKI
ncbi:acyl-CoA reductase [Flavobacterium beibuense]|uniref:Acyl-CoA reductase (LuxC) n=1 Tax=Flavobacterium beibuense TaxID=657326 RepID=A0A444WGF2_9FLAO|nr:acyl-CoA reductase [Flavobacterium beibuense]RYJ44943.1 Acyl-CoA reductase (LuxC) [Flavobacterium beibuense]